LTRLYARAPRGQRAYGTAPGHWHRLTVLGALALSGVICAMTIPAATDWPVFQAFLQHVLIPCLRQHKPGATLVMDHLAAHRLRQARPLLALRQAQECRLHVAAVTALLSRSVAH
jgi:DDE superfamily endonuclease